MSIPSQVKSGIAESTGYDSSLAHSQSTLANIFTMKLILSPTQP